MCWEEEEERIDPEAVMLAEGEPGVWITVLDELAVRELGLYEERMLWYTSEAMEYCGE